MQAGTTAPEFVWNSGEPNGATGENCVQLLTTMKLNDGGCSSSQKYICEQKGNAMLYVLCIYQWRRQGGTQGTFPPEIEKIVVEK